MVYNLFWNVPTVHLYKHKLKGLYHEIFEVATPGVLDAGESILTINAPAIMKVREVIFYAGKTLNWVVRVVF